MRSGLIRKTKAVKTRYKNYMCKNGCIWYCWRDRFGDSRMVSDVLRKYMIDEAGDLYPSWPKHPKYKLQTQQELSEAYPSTPYNSFTMDNLIPQTRTWAENYE